MPSTTGHTRIQSAAHRVDALNIVRPPNSNVELHQLVYQVHRHARRTPLCQHNAVQHAVRTNMNQTADAPIVQMAL